MNTLCPKSDNQCYGVKELDLLLEISKMLGKYKKDMKVNLAEVISLLAEYLKAERVIITILNRARSEISIELAYGMTKEEQDRGIYKIGEGIIGKVVQTGTTIVIPKIAHDQKFLNKTGFPAKVSDSDVTFICVPVKSNNEVIGTLSIHRVYSKHILFGEDVRILTIICSMIAQAVRFKQEYAEEIERLTDENYKLHSELRERIRPSSIIGRSGKMQAVFDLIERVADTNATVLIRGESGVGKELIADAIHFSSSRKNKPFIKVNCAALPESLIESELFGHEKGAFTGADNQRKGRFEAADGGTIFLDEIGDLQPGTQTKLLRIIQQRQFERVGSTKPIAVDVRIICATNRNLEELIEKNMFREDLYYRINVFPVFVPPLRERINDIPGLVDHFIEKFNKTHNKKIKRISSSAIDMLMVYHWPGNIRELENCIERACILSSENVIRSNNLPPTLQTSISSKTKQNGTLENVLDRVEKQMLLETLLTTKGNLAKAAKDLGLTERQIGLRIKKYNIDSGRFKPHKENSSTARIKKAS
jgi:Nif-specific regulatory protein